MNFLNARQRTKLIVLPILSGLFLQVGRPKPLWKYMVEKSFYFDLIFALLIGYLLWNYIQFCHNFLERKVGSRKNFFLYIVIQIPLAWLLPVMIQLGLYLSFMQLYYGETFQLEKSLVFQVDLYLSALLIVIINLILMITSLLAKPKPDSPQDQQPSSIPGNAGPVELNLVRQSKLLVVNGSRYTLLDREHLQYIRLQNGVPMACLRDGSTSVLNTPLNTLDETLPDYFFRINRNTIVNLKQINGFIAEKSGKLILKLASECNEEITVSQTRSVEFRNRLLSL